MGKSLSLSAAILLAFSLIQAAVLSNIPFLPSMPDFCMLCVLYFALQNGRFHGELTGFISGLFLDFISGAPLGFNCFYRTIIGYISGFFNKTLNTDGFLVPAILAFGATIMKALLLWLIALLFPAKVLTFNPFNPAFLFEIGMNVILAPLIFKFLGFFKKTLVLNPGKII